MAERSKAPDSRFTFSVDGRDIGNSGPRMRAWVRIPLLTKYFFRENVLFYFSCVPYGNKNSYLIKLTKNLSIVILIERVVL